LRIVEAIETARADGRLRPGERLLPQRELCKKLGVDLTTVTRAFSEARRRHLIDAAAGRGTFVTATGTEEPLLDLGMIIPPAPIGMNLPALIREGIDGLLKRSSAEALLSYHPGSGSALERGAASSWLERNAGRTPLDRIVVGAGSQTLLTAVVLAMTSEGDAVLCDDLTYPGTIALVKGTGRTLCGVEADADGMRPDRLERAARESGAKLLYLNPTFHNPTALVMPEKRRGEIAAVARRIGLVLVEDDPYGALISEPPPSFAALMPEATIHVATLSKCISPFLRTAFLIGPDSRTTDRIATMLRRITLMAPPLMTGLATEWIRSGLAGDIAAAIRAEVEARQALARTILPPETSGHRQALHLWLPLRDDESASKIVETARFRSLSVSADSDFATTENGPRGLRIALGAIRSRATLSQALTGLVAARSEPSGPRSAAFV
jgi:DNA-binding transcriptional MocR family regulator